MYLLRVLFCDGGEHTQQFKDVRLLFVFFNKGKSMTLGLKIHNRHRRVDRLTRSCGKNEQGEVSALFQEKRITNTISFKGAKNVPIKGVDEKDKSLLLLLFP